MRQLVADVARIAGLVAGGPGEERVNTETADEPAAGPPAVRAWLLTADPAQAATDLVDLAAWIDDVYLHYPDAVLASCWLWHPHVVEELWWLRRAHADAYHPQDGTWLRAGDWHDRQRPAVARRVRETIGKCDLSLHIADRQQDRPPAVAPLAGHAVQVATAWAASRVRPAPTRDQLDEAAAYVRALHRTRR